MSVEILGKLSAPFYCKDGKPTAALLKINPYPELAIDTDWTKD